MREMKQLTATYNLPLPNIKMEEPYLVITFPRKANFLKALIGENIYQNLNDEEISGLTYLHNSQHLSKKEYADHFKFDEKKAQRHLSKFKKLGLTLSEGAGPSVRYFFQKSYPGDGI